MSYSQAVRAEGGPGIEDGGGGQPVKEGGQVVVSYEERANGRNQGEGMSLEEGEEEQERTLQVRSLEQLWKGKQYQNIHNQADTNRFAMMYRTSPSDKVNLEEALKEYSEGQEGKVRVRVEVNKPGGKLQ